MYLNSTAIGIHGLESSVKSYCRQFPSTFVSAIDSYLIDRNGRRYLDFLAGCGSLNYGHNHKVLRKALMEHLEGSAISMSLDLYSESKFDFMQTLNKTVLRPNNLDYRMQFCGPTGSNAVEAAIKLARKVTGRWNVVAFTNGFHGCSLGALAVTGSSHHRTNSEPLLSNVTRMPYDGYLGPEFDTSQLLDKMLGDRSSGVAKPAAILLEVVQGEGGLNVAKTKWLQKIAKISKKYDSVLIVDEIQTGCGRTGDFFAFQTADLKPDIITLAKSISGFGLPMAMVLLRPELDCWNPGEHNGTFRGNNLAFVTGAAALKYFWSDSEFRKDVRSKSEHLSEALSKISLQFPVRIKGRGFMQGIDVYSPAWSAAIQKRCFNNGLILEVAGSDNQIIKIMPPLTSTVDELNKGISIIANAIEETAHMYDTRVIENPLHLYEGLKA